MTCAIRNERINFEHAASNCCCGGYSTPLNNRMWSTKKKIRFLEDRLKELNDKKSDIQELIEELKGN